MQNAFNAKWSQISGPFAHYVQQQWDSNRKHWALNYRTNAIQGIHTNNYVESWHRTLKTKFIPPPEKHQMDELIQILKYDVVGYYQHQSARVQLGIQKQRVNKFQLKARLDGDSYTPDIMCTLGILITQWADHFVSNSFTSPLAVAYWVDYEVPSKRHAKPRILRCTCPHFQQHNSACKHMFCIAKQYKYLVVEAGCVPEAPPMDIEALLNNLYEDGALNKLDPAPAFVPVGLGGPNPSNQPLRLLSLCPADLLYNGDLEIKVILSNGSGSAPVKRPASRQQYDLQGALTEDPKSSELGPESPEEGQQGNAGTN
ncbi:hypothetical protein PtB15_15B231 [Puccinia triticina]|nr:hypothetical protein PtB15_15B231 [Puccinia triticina]